MRLYHSSNFLSLSIMFACHREKFCAKRHMKKKQHSPWNIGSIFILKANAKPPSCWGASRRYRTMSDREQNEKFLVPILFHVSASSSSSASPLPTSPPSCQRCVTLFSFAGHDSEFHSFAQLLIPLAQKTNRTVPCFISFNSIAVSAGRCFFFVFSSVPISVQRRIMQLMCSHFWKSKSTRSLQW